MIATKKATPFLTRFVVVTRLHTRGEAQREIMKSQELVSSVPESAIESSTGAMVQW